MSSIFRKSGAVRRSKGVAFAVLAVAGLAAAPGMASTIQVAQQSGNVFGGNGYTAVNIHSGSTQSVYAGAFAVKGDLNGDSVAENFNAFCLDIAHELDLPSGYQITSTPFSGMALSAAQMSDVQSLFNVVYSTISLADNAASAGFQLALWEIVNETSGSYSLAGGSFYASDYNSSSDAAIADGTSYLAALGGAATGHYDLTYLQSMGDPQQSQNLVTAMPSPVPLPAAGLMMLTALGGFGLASRRRRAA